MVILPPKGFVTQLLSTLMFSQLSTLSLMEKLCLWYDAFFFDCIPYLFHIPYCNISELQFNSMKGSKFTIDTYGWTYIEFMNWTTNPPSMKKQKTKNKKQKTWVHASKNGIDLCNVCAFQIFISEWLKFMCYVLCIYKFNSDTAAVISIGWVL